MLKKTYQFFPYLTSREPDALKFYLFEWKSYITYLNYNHELTDTTRYLIKSTNNINSLLFFTSPGSIRRRKVLLWIVFCLPIRLDSIIIDPFVIFF